MDKENVVYIDIYNGVLLYSDIKSWFNVEIMMCIQGSKEKIRLYYLTEQAPNKKHYGQTAIYI